MTVSFERATRVRAPIDRTFDLALSIDAHLDSMSEHHERAIAGVTSGRWYVRRLIDRRNVFLMQAAEQELGSE